MSATLSDIAKATGTSVSTVSRVLTGAAAARRISDQTRQKVAAAAREMGYRPNLLARSLRTRKTNTIAVMVSDIANPWFGQMASHIEQSLHRSGYSVIVCNSGEQADLETEYLQLLPQKGIDGLIVVPLATRRQELYRYLSDTTPVVVVDRPVEGIAASITSDQKQATDLLYTHLKRTGVKKVALVRGPDHVYTHRMRAGEIRSRFDVVQEYEGPAQRDTGRVAWAQLGARVVDAVICTNNFLGQGVIEAMAGGNYRPSIGCFDELALMDLLPIPIVCSVQDVKRIAEGAVEMLLRQIDGQTVPPMVIPAIATWNRAFQKRMDSPREKQ